MSTIASLEIVVTAATKGATAAIKDLTGGLSTMGTVAKAAGSEMAQSLAGLDYLQAKAKQTGMWLTTRLTLPLGISGLTAIYFASKMEQASVSLGTLLGNKEAAEAFRKELVELADVTPFTFGEIQKASTKLLAFGFAAEQTRSMLLTIGDAASALSLGSEGMDRVTRALGQIKAKGKLQADEMLQLTEAGIGGWQMLAKQMGKTTAEVMAMTTAGAIDSTTAINALLAGMNEQFGGMMKIQSQTLNGLLSTLRDKTEQIWVKLGNVFIPFIKVLTKLGIIVVSLIAKIPQWLYFVVGIPLAGVAALGPLVLVLLAVAKAYLLIKGIQSGLKIASVALGMANLRTETSGLIPIVAKAGKALGTAFSSPVKTISTLKLTAVSALTTILSWLDRTKKAAVAAPIGQAAGALGSAAVGVATAVPSTKFVSSAAVILADTAATLGLTSAKELQTAAQVKSLAVVQAEAVALQANATAAGENAIASGAKAIADQAELTINTAQLAALTAETAALVENTASEGANAIAIALNTTSGGAAAAGATIYGLAKDGVTAANTPLTLSELAAAAATGIFSAAVAFAKGVVIALGHALKKLWVSFIGLGWIAVAIAAFALLVIALKQLYDWSQKKYEVKIKYQIEKIEEAKGNVAQAVENYGRLSKEAEIEYKKMEREITIKVNTEIAKDKIKNLQQEIAGDDFWSITIRVISGPLAPVVTGFEWIKEHLIESSAATKSFNEGFKKTQDLLAKNVTVQGMEIINENIRQLEMAMKDMTPEQQKIAQGQLDILKSKQEAYKNELARLKEIAAQLKINNGLFIDAGRDTYINTQAKLQAGIPLEEGIDYGVGSVDPKTGERRGTFEQILQADIQAKIDELKSAGQEALKAYTIGKATMDSTYGDMLGQINAKGEMVGDNPELGIYSGSILAAQRAKLGAATTAQQAALDAADLAKKLAEIPKNINQILTQDWTEVGKNLHEAMMQLFDGFGADAANLQALIDQQAITNAIMSIIQALGTILTVMKDMPKKAITPTKQAWKSFGQMLYQAMLDILEGFKSMDLGMLKINESTIGSIANIASSLGTILTTIKDMPKKHLKTIEQNWHMLGEYLLRGMNEILKVFSGDAKGLAKQSEKMGSIGSIAGGLGSFIQALADMPKKFVKISPQSWTTLGLTIKDVMAQILKIFEDISAKTLAKDAEKLGSVGSAAGSISSMVTSFAEITKEVVKKALVGIAEVRKNVKTLATEMAKMIKDFIFVISGKGIKITEKESGGYDRLFGMVTNIAGVITSFSEMTEQSINKAIVALNETALKAPDIGLAIKNMIEALKGSLKSLKISDKFSGMAESAITIATNVGGVISTYSEITKKMIEKAVSGLQLATASTPALGKAMFDMVTALRSEIESFVGDEKFDPFTLIADKVVTIVGNVANIITAYAELTKSKIGKAVEGLQLTGDMGSDIGEAMATMVEKLAIGIGESSVDAEFVALTDSLVSVADKVGSILTQFAELTQEGIFTAIKNLDTVAANAPQIAGALMRMAEALKSAFTAAGINEAYADSMDEIGRVMETVSSVFNFATSMTEENIRILTEFAAGTNIMSVLWEGVGAALTRAINTLASSIHIIPDTSDLAEAEKAISSLSNIFSSLTGLMDTIPLAAAWTFSNPAPTATTPTVTTPGAVAAAGSGGGGSTTIDVDISWQTLTGEPSEREKRQLVSYIRPELERLVSDKMRSSF
jgi:tape measure domain-containing protein